MGCVWLSTASSIGRPPSRRHERLVIAATDQPSDWSCHVGLWSRHGLTNAYELLTRVVGRSKTFLEDAAPIGRSASNAQLRIVSAVIMDWPAVFPMPGVHRPEQSTRRKYAVGPDCNL